MVVDGRTQAAVAVMLGVHSVTVAKWVARHRAAGNQGLAAKPTIDIQVCVRDLEDEPSYVPALESLDLQLRSRDALHRYFRPVRSQPV